MNKKIKSPREIIERVSLLQRLEEKTINIDSRDSRKIFLSELKNALEFGRGVIKKRFLDHQSSGVETIREMSFLHDQLIRVIFDFTSNNIFNYGIKTKGDKLSLVALGGFGRQELAPESDLDLLFLLPYKHTPFTEQLVEYILYILWDLGLKVGHAVRTIDENIRQAKNDMTILTSLLESRWLWGDQSLYEEFYERFRELTLEKKNKKFIKSKLDERNNRHLKHGDSRYILEPDVKEYKGGLRDLQALVWIINYVYQTRTIHDFAEEGFIDENDKTKFLKCINFLCTVRVHIHYLTQRSDNRLTFDLQSKISGLMGYKDRKGVRAVERFMKHYYLIAKEVGELTGLILNIILEGGQKKGSISLFGFFKRSNLEGFHVSGKSISVKSGDEFINDPIKLIKIFELSLTHKLNIHPKMLKLINRNLGCIKQLREDPEANRIFINILSSKINNQSILRLMSETGFLSRFCPDYAKVVAQMQFDMYHVYTTDEHTIRAIGLLQDVEAGKLAMQMPIQSQIFSNLYSRRTLFVAVFLHDIAKGRGGDHSVIGAEIAKKLCPRFGLDTEEVETVSWLVRYHLLMSNTAFKRDIDDQQTLANFCNEVKSLERLNLLYVLTSVDIKAVGPNVWNEWKGQLLHELYNNSVLYLSGIEDSDGTNVKINKIKKEISERLFEWKPKDIKEFLALGTPKYWLCYDIDSHLRYAKIINKANSDGKKIVISFEELLGTSNVEMLVYAPDHIGLFSKIAGTLSLVRCTILDARIQTLSNGMALDTFTVSGLFPGEIDYESRNEKVRQRIIQALGDTVNVSHELNKSTNLVNKNISLAFNSPSRVIIDNDASKYSSVIEINSNDRAGLLFSVTSLISSMGIQILSAHISTYGENAVDVFYIKDIFGMKIKDKNKLNQIKESLLCILDKPNNSSLQDLNAKENY